MLTRTGHKGSGALAVLHAVELEALRDEIADRAALPRGSLLQRAVEGVGERDRQASHGAIVHQVTNSPASAHWRTGLDLGAAREKVRVASSLGARFTTSALAAGSRTRLVRLWRRTDRLAEQERERFRHAGRYVRATTDEDGMVVLQARLDPEGGAALLKALAAAADKLHDAGAGSRSRVSP